MSFTISINDQAAFEVQFAGPAGPTGPQGPQGIQGVPGEGVAVGGTTGQVLKKASNADYDTVWSSDISGVSWGGITGTLSAQTDLQNALDAKLSTSSASSTYLPLAGGYITGDLQSNNGSGYRTWDGGYKTANLQPEYLQLNNAGVGGNSLTIEWDGISFADGKQTVRYPGTGVLDGLYYPLSSNPAGYLTSAALSGLATESWVTAGFYPLTGNPSGFITSSALSPYLLSATAASTYAVIAAGQPTSGTVGQVLTKNSGTNYDSSWATLIPGDRYLTSSTTSNTLSNGNKTFTIGTGLSYTPTQNITISFDAANHMHGEVLTYNSGTGVLTVDIKNHTGTGTYAAWVVNVGGVTPATTVAWGAITGTIGSQSDLATELNAKLNLTGGALTGSVTNADATYDSEFAGWGLGVQQSADHTKGTTVEFNGLDTYDGASHMQVTPTGIIFPDSTTQTTAAPPPVTNNSQLSTTVYEEAGYDVYVNPTSFARSSIIKLTCPMNPAVYLETGYATGDQILFVNLIGGAYINFLAGSGMTLLSPAGVYCVGTGGVVAAVYVGADTWVISGKLQASI
jgi:hypothetical protein